jgi:hypothetical protein
VLNSFLLISWIVGRDVAPVLAHSRGGGEMSKFLETNGSS